MGRIRKHIQKYLGYDETPDDESRVAESNQAGAPPSSGKPQAEQETTSQPQPETMERIKKHIQKYFGYDETPDDESCVAESNQAGALTSSGKPQAEQETTSQPQPAATQDLSIVPENGSSDLQETLWDRAYESLKEEDSKLMDAYETILSSYLEKGPGPDPTDAQKNIVEQNDKNKRRHQMNRLMDAGRERIAKEAKIKDSLSTITDAVLTTKDVISAAVDNVSQASLAWGGVCVVLEFLTNPLKATSTQISGIKEVVRIMTGILRLSDDLFKKSPETESLTQVQLELETQAIDLFKEILKYQVNSICALYRNRGVVFLRDMFQLDGWDTDLTAIQDLEKRFVKFTQTYSSRQVVDNTSQMVDLMKKQEKRKLSKEDKECMQALCQIDAYIEKDRIERTKGYLLEDAYRWILSNPEFLRWRDGSKEDMANRLLWIKGGAGRGKTMLLCGIINELKKSAPDTPLSFFLCQATDSRINSSTAVLRGLIRSIVKEQPCLMPHVREKYDDVGKSVFEPPSAWDTLREILRNMLQDKSFRNTFIAIDALDECVQELTQLLDLVVDFAKKYPCVKWIVTSRNDPLIASRLDNAEHLGLELDDDLISKAVDVYISFKVKNIVPLKNRPQLQDRIRNVIHDKADNTFLWAALLFEELKNIQFPDPRQLLKIIKTIPSGLNEFYGHMMETICNRNKDDERRQCYTIIATVLLAHQPLHLLELANLAVNIVEDSDEEDPVLENLGLEDLHRDKNYMAKSMEESVNKCGSFLVTRDNTVYFVHQSAKDFLTKGQAYTTIFPSGIEAVHYNVFYQSLKCMGKILHRDMYGLSHLGISIDDVVKPNPDPLVPVKYSCVYWIDHLCDAKKDVPLGDVVFRTFFETFFLNWLEALSLSQSISEGVAAMRKLKDSPAGGEFTSLIYDAYRFIFSHRWLIENHPLQTYVSALLFSPTNSKIRKLFAAQEPSWVTVKPVVEEDWSAYSTLRGHKNDVASVATSPDGLYIASTAGDGTIRIWEASSGNCIRVLRSHNDDVGSAVFSPDGNFLGSASNSTVQLWEVSSGDCIGKIADSSIHHAVTFSPEGRCLCFTWKHEKESSNEDDKDNNTCIDIWDVKSGEIVKTLPQDHPYNENDRILCSASGKKLFTNSMKSINRIWDLFSNQCIELKSKAERTYAAFSPDDKQIATDEENCIKLWDTSTGECIRAFKDHEVTVMALMFLPFESQLASASLDSTIKIWNTASGECTATFFSEEGWLASIAYSQPNHLLIAASRLCVLTWDINATAQARPCNTRQKIPKSMCFSTCGKYLAYESYTDIQVWDATSGTCREAIEHVQEDRITGNPEFSPVDDVLAYPLIRGGVALWDVTLGKHTHTLHGDSRCTYIVFSSDGRKLASKMNGVVQMWDTASGACIREIDIPKDEDKNISFTEDLDTFATYDRENELVTIYSSVTGICMDTLPFPNIRKIVLSADAKLLAIESEEGLWIWDRESPPREIPRVDNTESISMTFSADNDCLVRLYGDTISIYSILHDTETRITLPEDPTAPIFSLFFTQCIVKIKGNQLLLTHGYIRFPSSLKEESRQEAEWLDYGISGNGLWITLHGQNILWLPSKYEPIIGSVQDLTICVAGLYGQVAIIGFSPDRSTWPLQEKEGVVS